MKRTNFFKLIHEALRCLLFDTARQLQCTDFNNEDSASAALDAIRETILLFETHAQHEDLYILPAVATYEPSVSDCFEKEHAEDQRIGQELIASVETFFLAGSADERLEKGCALMAAYNAFVVFNLAHMAKEERILNELLLRYYTQEEVMAVQQRIVESTAPWIYDRIAHWMLLGNNEADTVQWLRAVAVMAPPIVHQSLLQKAAQILAPARWAALQRRLQPLSTAQL